MPLSFYIFIIDTPKLRCNYAILKRLFKLFTFLFQNITVQVISRSNNNEGNTDAWSTNLKAFKRNIVMSPLRQFLKYLFALFTWQCTIKKRHGQYFGVFFFQILCGIQMRFYMKINFYITVWQCIVTEFFYIQRLIQIDVKSNTEL